MRYLAAFLLLFTCSVGLAGADTATYVLNDSDIDNFYNGFQHALETSPNYQSSDWFNPDTGLNGTTVPLKTLRTSDGKLCREFLATVQISGVVQQSVGTACRLVNGAWAILDEKILARADAQVNFVIARQQKQLDCAQRERFPAHRPLWTPAPLQYSNGEQVAPQRSTERFHSRQFHEALRRLQQQSPDAAQPQRQPPPPSKLIKLVAY